MISPAFAAILFALAAGQEDEEDEINQVPEPMLLESITDIDRATAGEIEMDIDFQIVPSIANSILGGRFETEWRATQRLGLAMELSFAREVKTADNYAFGARFGASYVLIHDFVHNFHMQAVATARAPLETDETIAHDPAETVLPWGGGLHAAFAIGDVALRAEVLAELGEGKVEHAPIHGGLVALLRAGELGFFGVEWIQDWALLQPFTIAPEVVFDGEPRHLPFRIGVVVPIHLGVTENRAFNVITRLILELD